MRVPLNEQRRFWMEVFISSISGAAVVGTMTTKHLVDAAEEIADMALERVVCTRCDGARVVLWAPVPGVPTKALDCVCTGADLDGEIKVRYASWREEMYDEA